MNDPLSFVNQLTVIVEMTEVCDSKKRLIIIRNCIKHSSLESLNVIMMIARDKVYVVAVTLEIESH